MGAGHPEHFTVARTMSQTYTAHQRAARDLPARCAIITFSDTRTESTDASGPLIRSLLVRFGHEVSVYRVVRESEEAIAQALDQALGRSDVDVLLLSGGTGIAPRDRTIDVVQSRLHRPLPGFGELFRMLSYRQVGSGAMLSRAVAGIARDKVIFAMPGSPAAVELAMNELILPELRHLLDQMRG
jgi:molybdenum cofactor biosynthesis protein B